jgi:hypothetical protein
MNPFKKFALSLLVLVGISFAASAQPYYTNSSPQYGEYNPNRYVVPPTQPLATLNAQYALGINSGTSATSTDGTVTNAFATNYVYSVTPVVTVTQTGAVITPTNSVVSVTLTNFIYKAGAANTTNNWTAIGR